MEKSKEPNRFIQPFFEPSNSGNGALPAVTQTNYCITRDLAFKKPHNWWFWFKDGRAGKVFDFCWDEKGLEGNNIESNVFK